MDSKQALEKLLPRGILTVCPSLHVQCENHLYMHHTGLVGQKTSSCKSRAAPGPVEALKTVFADIFACALEHLHVGAPAICDFF